LIATPMTTQEQPRNDLALAEAALFLASQPLTRRALAGILGGVALTYVDQLLEDLQDRFHDGSRGIELVVEDGRAMFRVKAAYVSHVAHLAPQQDISKPILRTLAVIAYNNPMTQADLIKVRGNKGYGHVQELLERNLIASEEHGRTLLLSVTKEFLRHFGLRSVEEFRFHFAASVGQDVLDAQDDDAADHDDVRAARDAEHQTLGNNGAASPPEPAKPEDEPEDEPSEEVTDG
jgi:segregation and condensation protein B